MIKNLVEIYGGEFSNKRIKKDNPSKLKHLFLVEQGILQINTSTLRIELYENSNNQLQSNFYRLSLCLNEIYNTKINIYPIDSWNQILDKIFSKRREFIPIRVREQFWFNGDKKIIVKISLNQQFYENINNEKVFIETVNGNNTCLVLTPQNGKMSKEQCESFIEVLKLIENTIKTTHKSILPSR